MTGIMLVIVSVCLIVVSWWLHKCRRRILWLEYRLMEVSGENHKMYEELERLMVEKNDLRVLVGAKEKMILGLEKMVKERAASN